MDDVWNEQGIEKAPRSHIVLVPPFEFLTFYWNKQKTGRATQHNAHISWPCNTQNHESMLNKLIFVYELLYVSRYTTGDDIVKPNFHVMDPQANTFVPKRWRWQCTWGSNLLVGNYLDIMEMLWSGMKHDI